MLTTKKMEKRKKKMRTSSIPCMMKFLVFAYVIAHLVLYMKFI